MNIVYVLIITTLVILALIGLNRLQQKLAPQVQQPFQQTIPIRPNPLRPDSVQTPTLTQD